MAAIEPFYPKGDGRGRPPIGLEQMLRMDVAQNGFGLSDEGVEEAIYGSQAIRCFVGIDLGRQAVPEATTLSKFRRLLEEKGLTDSIFNAINVHLAERGLFMRQGTVADATIIAAPPSTKNRAGKRDPEMPQTRKGNQWHFGMKFYIGACPRWLVRQPRSTTSPKRKPCCMVKDRCVRGCGLRGGGEAGGKPGCSGNLAVAMKRSVRRALPKNPWGEKMELIEQTKTSICTKVEPAFQVVKNLFLHRQPPTRSWRRTRRSCSPCLRPLLVVLAEEGKVAS